MNPLWVPVAWSMIAGVCLAIGLIHFVAWLKQFGQRAYLAFSVMAASVASIAICEMLAMRAQTPAEYGTILRWAHVPFFLLVASLLVFVRSYFGTGRLWLACAVFGLRLLSLILDFLFDPNLNYREITALRQVELWGDVTASVAVGVPNPWVRVAELSSLLLIVFIADASLAVWRFGGRIERRRAAVVGGSLVFFFSVAAANAALVHAGVVQSIYLVSVPFLAVVGAIGWELGADLIRSMQLAGRLQKSEADLHRSERRMELAADAAKIGTWEWDVGRDAIWVNQQGRALFGIAAAEAIDLERFLDTLHPEDRGGAREAVVRALEAGSSYEGELRVMLPDGRVRWVATRGRAEPDAGGGRGFMRGVSFDITERKQAEERFRLVTQAESAGIIMLDAGGRIRFANARAEADFGYTQEELMGKSIEVLVPERFSARHAVDLGRFFANPSARMMAVREVVGRRKDGSEIPVEIGLNPIPTPAGMSVLAMIIDVTGRRQAEMDLAQQRSELAHLSRVTMLSELSGSLAHELNQPLTAILSNAQAALRFMAEREPNLDEVREILQDIVSDDKRAGETIRGLRLLLKKGEMRTEPLDVNEVVQDVLRLVHSDLLNAGVSAATELAADLPRAACDRVQVQQVLINLIMNGCDAMAFFKAPERRLVVSTERAEGESIRIRVQDEGRGLPSGDLERVFEPFFTTKNQGLGMGLAVCRKIIASHGGRLWAENNAGRGASFFFTLPAHTGGAA